MPKQPPRSSTARRKELVEHIELFGDDMVKACSSCAKHSRRCRIHARSGKCSECLKRNQSCDVKVTQSEFRRLADEKKKLQRGIQEAVAAQESAFAAHEAALEALRIARSREQRLRQQMDLVDARASDAIAVESAALEELDLASVPAGDLNLHLSPGTWAELDNQGVDWWDSVLYGPDGTVAAVVGSSSDS